MKIKRTVCTILAFMLLTGLCACTKKDSSENMQDEAAIETTNNSENTCHINIEPVEHLIIDADVVEPNQDEYSVFSLQFSMPTVTDVADHFFCGKETQIVNNDSDSLYVTSADGGEFSCNKYGLSFYISEYDKWAEIASIMNYYIDIDYYEEITPPDYMTKEDVEELVESTIKDCAISFTPVITKCISMSHTDLIALQQKLLSDPEKHYDDFGKAFNLSKLDSSDDAYFVAFSFAYDDIPIFSQEEASWVSYSVPNMLMSNGMSGEMVITAEGVKYLEIMGACFTPTLNSSSKILTVDEAVEKLTEKYELEILQSDQIYSSVYIEYMPIEKENGQIYLTPYWCFDCSINNNQSGDNYSSIIRSVRFNATTGEDFSYGG
jgi:hypothetical protein